MFKLLFLNNNYFFSWCSGEPNNWGGDDTTIGEGCAQFKQTCLNDQGCSDKLWFICRRSPLTKPMTKPDPAASTTTTTTTTTKAPTTTTTTTPAKTNPNLKFDPELYLLE